MTHLLDQGFKNIRESLDTSKVSAEELALESFKRLSEKNKDLNAFISVYNRENILEQAKLADKRLQQGERTPLLGIPVGIKDLILTKGHTSTAASKMLENFVPPYSATVVEKLEASGATFLGKCNLDEFAMGSSNETSYFGPCKNPHDLSRVPGGSSGGSAAAVAAGICPLTLGTDTGGSIRQPASFCGITGIKPTYGRVSRYGVIAFASSLDQVGPMGCDTLATAAGLEEISGYDGRDSTSRLQDKVSFYEDTKKTDPLFLKGLRVGVPSEFFGEGLDSGVKESVEKTLDLFKSAGAELIPVKLPHMKYSLPVYYLICTSEASSNLGRYDGVHVGRRSEKNDLKDLEDLYSHSRAEGFGLEVKTRILLGSFALSSGYYDAFYKKASQVRQLIKQDFVEAFKSCDLIVGPTAPTVAFAAGTKTKDPLQMYLSDIYTLAINLAGVPAISFPSHFLSQNLPVGIQAIAPWFQEQRLLSLARSHEILGVSRG